MSYHNGVRVRKLKKCGECIKGHHQNCVSIYCGCGTCPSLQQAKEEKK